MSRLVLTMCLAALLLAAGCADAPAEERPAERAPVAAAPESPMGEFRSIALHVPDMVCRLCARPIERNLEDLGVRDVKADLNTKWVTGRYDPARLSPEAIRSAVERLKFRVAEVRAG